MKMRAILALVVGILAVHTLVLFLFLRGGGSDSASPAEETAPVPETAADAGITPAPLQQTMTPATDPAVKSAATDYSVVRYADSVPNPPEDLPSTPGAIPSGTGTAPVKEAIDPELIFLPKNPNFGQPLNYRYAVYGDLPRMPGSKAAATGILVDLNTRNVLWAKNPQKPHPIASMTKIMTLLLAYEDVERRRDGITLNTPVKVSRKASLIRESRVWLAEGEVFPLRDLMMAAAIKSANDAAYLLAEFLGGGDAEQFVARMNSRAGELGMKHTNFFNSNGLPGRKSSLDNVASPEDMLILAEHTLTHPLLVEWAATRTADFRPPTDKRHVQMVNHNHLLKGGRYPCPGVNGLKTGFISRSGFCVTASCVREKRVLVAVLTGFSTQRERDSFARDLINWGYKRIENPSAPLIQPKTSAPRANASPMKKNTRKK